MAYSDFTTFDQINPNLGIAIEADNELYRHIEPVKLTAWFIETMKMAYTKAVRINTESSRQALIVDNVLMELNQHIIISFFLENTLPVVVLVEAKKSDLGSGLPLCGKQYSASLTHCSMPITRRRAFLVLV